MNSNKFCGLKNVYEFEKVLRNMIFLDNLEKVRINRENKKGKGKFEKEKVKKEKKNPKKNQLNRHIG